MSDFKVAPLSAEELQEVLFALLDRSRKSGVEPTTVQLTAYKKLATAQEVINV